MAGKEGEWNQVGRKHGRLRHIAKASNPVTLALEPGLDLGGLRPNPNPELTVSDIHRHHEAATQDWNSSECWKSLQAILLEATAAQGRPIVTKAVFLGPGPYDPSNGSFAARRTAHMQTAAFRSIVRTIDSRNGNGRAAAIRCVVQEPCFTPTDKEFCAAVGLEVAESPAAFALVDEATLVFGIHMELPTYHQALRGCLPAIFIGAGLGEWQTVKDFDPASGPLLAPIAEMDAAFDKFAFPDLNYMFSSTAVYWRRGAGGDGAESTSTDV
ncbi:hypothetical protein B0T26DRAFT_633521 [Lasiosphaeria miniovina]|uniref:SRR1-like domain-containing protein n=1 Tax=Lasiosphaeria miniovina TaxID=1954250 RepID=A0AA40ED09_9PEZI|nr:uncharacterized protein B0T26DRAFT_633521 [Lasiosphaeria miniovina]KAK0733822.1 hypothetical protein B0T26DRAFT_633521 [Lasiosphaeria miniovina]